MLRRPTRVRANPIATLYLRNRRHYPRDRRLRPLRPVARHRSHAMVLAALAVRRFPNIPHDHDATATRLSAKYPKSVFDIASHGGADRFFSKRKDPVAYLMIVCRGKWRNVLSKLAFRNKTCRPDRRMYNFLGGDDATCEYSISPRPAAGDFLRPSRDTRPRRARYEDRASSRGHPKNRPSAPPRSLWRT